MKIEVMDVVMERKGCRPEKMQQICQNYWLLSLEFIRVFLELPFCLKRNEDWFQKDQIFKHPLEMLSSKDIDVICFKRRQTENGKGVPQFIAKWSSVSSISYKTMFQKTEKVENILEQQRMNLPYVIVSTNMEVMEKFMDSFRLRLAE